MMLFLVLYVTPHTFDLGLADRKRSIPVLPFEFWMNSRSRPIRNRRFQILDEFGHVHCWSQLHDHMYVIRDAADLYAYSTQAPNGAADVFIQTRFEFRADEGNPFLSRENNMKQ